MRRQALQKGYQKTRAKLIKEAIAILYQGAVKSLVRTILMLGQPNFKVAQYN